MRSPLMLGAIAAALLGATSATDRTRQQSSPRPNLDPSKAVSGNKARLLERYERRQARLKKGGPDHG